MAEVVGLVAAGGQFIEQSITIIQLSKKIRDKYKDTPQEVEGWQNQMESLQKVVETVRQSPSLQVSDVNSTIEQCKSVSDSLLDVFEKIQFERTDSFLHKTWRVVVSFSKEDEIRTLFSQLEQLKSTLDIQIGIVNLNNNQTVVSTLKNIKFSSESGTDEDKCLRALFVTDPVSDREGLVTAKGNRTPGTFEWVPKTKEYRDWNASDHSVLWISGPPGKGKTIMSIFLSKLMETTKPSSTVIFFFCDNKVATRNSAVNILRGLMSQLIQCHPHLNSILYSTWNVQQENLFRTTSFETLWRIFIQMLEDLRHQDVYCVLDALDECDEESLKLLLSKIKILFDSSNDIASRVSLKLIIASREDPKCIPQSLTVFPRIMLENLNDDIELYILDKVAHLSRMKNIEGPLLQSRIETAFRDGAQGTFLWVSYMSQELEHKSLSDIEHALKELPRGLYEIYERILRQIKVEKRDKIAEMLMWILFAERPLTISELCDAIKIQSSQTLTREEICFDYILLCGNLLQLHEDEEYGDTLAVYLPSTAPIHADKLRFLRVTFLHQSIKDFLLGTDTKPSAFRIITDSKEAHTIILDYIIGLLEEHLCYELDIDDRIELLKRIPLLRYAVESWSFHMRQLYDDIKPILSRHRAFFGRRSMTRDTWAKCSQEGGCWDSYPGLTLLHLACAEGLHSLARTWLLPDNLILRLRNRRTINQQAGHSRYTALQLAAGSGSIETVRLLLDCGADVSIEDKNGMTPLHEALQNWHCDIYELLLVSRKSRQVFEREAKSFSERPDFRRSSLLHLAAEVGNEIICDELVKNHKYSVEWLDHYGQGALHRALRQGHAKLADRLVTHWGASLKPEINVLRSISRFGLLGRDQQEFLRMYSDNWGCDINAVDEKGNTIFHDRFLRAPAMQAILDWGLPIDWNRRNKRKETFLHCATRWMGDPRLLYTFLRSSQFGINARDCNGYTPLHSLSTIEDDYIGHVVGVAQLLLDFGADRSLRDNRGRSALDIAREELKYEEGSWIINKIQQFIGVLTDYTTVAVDVAAVDLRLDDRNWPYIERG